MVLNRLDKILVDKGLSESRERARALVMEGKVLVDGIPVTKAGAQVKDSSQITVKGGEMPFVSRGGLKLAAALEHFGISLTGKTAMDIGISTGGFTDCMLQNGAERVFGVDVGYGQLAWKLRNDPRVVVLERTNIRHLERGSVREDMDFVTIDVSFISLKLVLPKALEFLRDDGEILALVKPQFEVGKGQVGKGGVVRDEAKRLEAVESIAAFAAELGLEVLGSFASPVPGPSGNIEYFLYLKG